MRAELEHTHQCRKCGYVVPGNEIDLKAISTGIITCPRCGASGPINIQILSRQDIRTNNEFTQKSED
jgi:DNA-directed RNA polymerase subunit M/transcription elongation factor TFIIS